MRVVVTGGAGFIGSHVSDAFLERGDDVLVVDDFSSGNRENLPSGAELAELDVGDADRFRERLEAFRPDLICHLAAQASVTVSVTNPELDFASNVRGTFNVCQAAADLQARILFASTGGALYGNDAPIPTPETFVAKPLSPYGASKLAGEAFVSTQARSNRLGHAVLRLGNVYGPRQNAHGRPASSPSSAIDSSTTRCRSSTATGSRRATTCTSPTSPVRSCSPPAAGSREPSTSAGARRCRCSSCSRCSNGRRAPTSNRSSSRSVPESSTAAARSTRKRRRGGGGAGDLARRRSRRDLSLVRRPASGLRANSNRFARLSARRVERRKADASGSKTGETWGSAECDAPRVRADSAGWSSGRRWRSLAGQHARGETAFAAGVGKQLRIPLEASGPLGSSVRILAGRLPVGARLQRFPTRRGRRLSLASLREAGGRWDACWRRRRQRHCARAEGLRPRRPTCSPYVPTLASTAAPKARRCCVRRRASAAQ